MVISGLTAVLYAIKYWNAFTFATSLSLVAKWLDSIYKILGSRSDVQKHCFEEELL